MTVHERADHWFARSRAALLGALPCSRGCSRCCVGLFAITRLDAELLVRGLSTLAESVRASVEDRANEQVSALEGAFPDLRQSRAVEHWTDQALDDAARRFAALPCPALGAGGECLVYPWRPLTCRLMGIPVDEHGVTRGACDVQTAIPLARLPHALRQEEDRLAEQEAAALHRPETPERGVEEVWLPYGFVRHVTG